MKKHAITASKFDEKYDKREGFTEYLDLKNMTKPGNRPKLVILHIPFWSVQEPDKVSNKLG